MSAPEGYIEIEVDIAEALRRAVDTLGVDPETVVLHPVHTWFPFWSTDVIRIQFATETHDA